MAMINGQSLRSACGLPRESKYCVMKKQTPKPMKETQKHITVSQISPVRMNDTQARKKGMENKLTPMENAKTILHLRPIPLLGVTWSNAGGMGGGSFSFTKRSVFCWELDYWLGRRLWQPFLPIECTCEPTHVRGDEHQQANRAPPVKRPSDARRQSNPCGYSN
jgi:hypothetical protein